MSRLSLLVAAVLLVLCASAVSAGSICRGAACKAYCDGGKANVEKTYARAAELGIATVDPAKLKSLPTEIYKQFVAKGCTPRDKNNLATGYANCGLIMSKSGLQLLPEAIEKLAEAALRVRDYTGPAPKPAACLGSEAEMIAERQAQATRRAHIAAPRSAVTNQQYAITVMSAARSLKTQMDLLCAHFPTEPDYQCGPSLACPGGSNHGLGFAIDICLKDPTGRTSLTECRVSNIKSRPYAENLSMFTCKNEHDRVMDDVLFSSGWQKYENEMWHYEYRASGVVPAARVAGHVMVPATGPLPAVTKTASKTSAKKPKKAPAAAAPAAAKPQAPAKTSSNTKGATSAAPAAATKGAATPKTSTKTAPKKVAAPPAPRVDAGRTWTPVGAGVSSSIGASGACRVLLAFGGYTYSLPTSQTWAHALAAGADVSQYGIDSLYAIKGPKDLKYQSKEIATSKIATALAAISAKPACAAPVILVAGHSSGAYVSNDFIRQIAKIAPQLLQRIVYFNLDGANGGVKASVINDLGLYVSVSAHSSGTLQARNYNGMVASFPKAQRRVWIDLDTAGSGCTVEMCVHMTLINKKPYKPAGWGERDAYDFNAGHPVQADYIKKVSAQIWKIASSRADPAKAMGSQRFAAIRRASNKVMQP